MYTNISCHSEDDHHCFFQKQVQFTAKENLAAERSESYVKPRFKQTQDIWRKPPPDFSVKLYTSLNLQRKPSESDENGKRPIYKIQISKQANVLQPVQNDRLPRIIEKWKPVKFRTRFKDIGEFEANLMYVKNGVYPKDKYKDPRPHDFRQYEVGIPDINTSYSRDPLNLKFKSQHLNCIYGIQPLEEKRMKSMFRTHKPAALLWDSSLILPKTPWPPKSASFTRHRRRRGVYTAFMDRVEEKFTKAQNMSC